MPHLQRLPLDERESFVRVLSANNLDAGQFQVIIVERGPVVMGKSTHRMVQVARRETGILRQYNAGPRYNWVSGFSIDLELSVYHPVTMR